MSTLRFTVLSAALAVLVAPTAQALDFLPPEQPKGLRGLAMMKFTQPELIKRTMSEPVIDEDMVEARNAGQVPLPRCRSAEVSLRIVEPDDGQALWASYGLPMPTRMLRSFVTESSCFRVLDRSVGFAAAQAERELASGGHLQRGSNLGGGQMLAADYILIPDIVAQNTNAGGRNASLGGGGSSGLGRLLLGGGGSSQRKTASVMLSLVDTRTSEVLATATGEAQISDKQWQAMAAGSANAAPYGASGHANVSMGAYENTPIGTVIRAAYHHAYHQLLLDLEPVDLKARISEMPEATRQTQVAQTTAYSTGGSPTHTTSAAPAQMQLDQHAAHSDLHAQQRQQMQQQQQQMQVQQMQQQQLAQLHHQAAQGMAQPGLPQAGQVMQAMAGQAVPAGTAQMLGAAVQGFQQGNPGQAVMQGAAQQLVGQVVPAGTAQMVGAAVQGLQQGNLGQTVMQGAAQQLVGQALPAGTAQMVGAAVQGLQQGNPGQAVMQGAAQQLVGQTLPAGTAQMVGAAVQGLQQGNLGQALVQGAVQQFAGTPAAAMGVLVLKVPANLLADPGGAGNPIRVLQPGETLARLGLNPQGSMIQVRDSQGVIGWIPASTHADLISISQ